MGSVSNPASAIAKSRDLARESFIAGSTKLAPVLRSVVKEYAASSGISLNPKYDAENGHVANSSGYGAHTMRRTKVSLTLPFATGGLSEPSRIEPIMREF